MWSTIHKLVLKSHDSVIAARFVKFVEQNEQDIDFNAQTSLGATALHFACVGESSDIVSFLLAHGADVNLRNNYGETPLHWACKNGDTDIIQILLSAGADVTIRDVDGTTPAEWALQEGNNELANLLIPTVKTTNFTSSMKNYGKRRCSIVTMYCP